jgi:hypothetical protein
VLLGTAMPFAEIVNRSRGTSHNPGGKALNPWFPGVIVSTTSDQNNVVLTFSFNEGSQGWHYAWQSHRMTRQTRHCLHVFILAARRDEQSTFTCVVELFSPSFDIFCRRKRTRDEDDEETAESSISGSVFPKTQGIHGCAPGTFIQQTTNFPAKNFQILGAPPTLDCGPASSLTYLPAEQQLSTAQQALAAAQERLRQLHQAQVLLGSGNSNDSLKAQDILKNHKLCAVPNNMLLPATECQQIHVAGGTGGTGGSVEAGEIIATPLTHTPNALALLASMASPASNNSSSNAKGAGAPPAALGVSLALQPPAPPALLGSTAAAVVKTEASDLHLLAATNSNANVYDEGQRER